MSSEQPEPRSNVRGDSLERADQAWKARVAGATWAQAADVAGFENGANAFRAVKNFYATAPEVERDELRRLWRARLEVLWKQALRDALEHRSGALVAAVRVAAAASNLDGLDEPSRLEVSSPSTERIEQWVSLVMAERRPELEEAEFFDEDDDELEEPNSQK